MAKAGAGFRSLRDAWADTTTPHGRLMLTVLGGLAEFERELIRARTGEGRDPRQGARRSHGPHRRSSPAPARGSPRGDRQRHRHAGRPCAPQACAMTYDNPAFFAWMDEVNREAVRRGLPD